MTKPEFNAAFKLAQTDADLTNEDISIFDGFGLPDFKSITCTIQQLARLIRWQCFVLNGTIDAKALNEIAFHGKKRFVVLGA